MKDSLLILSGGVDSVTMLYEFRDSIAMALTFDYGGNHNWREATYAELHCQRLKIPHLTIPLEFISEHFHSALLEGAGAIPEEDYDSGNMKATAVPFRNGIMLAIAAGMAETRHLQRIMMANHSGDHAIYPDCRPDFVKAMDAAVQAGTYDGITLYAPYTGLDKTAIVRRGKALGIDYSETWSCYKGEEVHCGLCGTCRERRSALREAGIEDKTVYGCDLAEN